MTTPPLSIGGVGPASARLRRDHSGGPRAGARGVAVCPRVMSSLASHPYVATWFLIVVHPEPTHRTPITKGARSAPSAAFRSPPSAWPAVGAEVIFLRARAFFIRILERVRSWPAGNDWIDRG
jgi:hypothetical protein